MIFQKDYWRMSTEELEKEGNKHNIGGWELGHFDRDYVINTLLARDQAMRTGINVVATLVSVGSMLINLALLFFHHH